MAGENRRRGRKQAMKRTRYLLAGVFVLVLGAGLIACTGGSSSSIAPPVQQQATAPLAIYGEDAPLASVVTFQLTLSGLTASDGVNTTTLISTPQTVDFARLQGLRTLLDLNNAPPGSYTSIPLTLATPVIGYIATTNPAAPTITMQNGTLTTSSITVL